MNVSPMKVRTKYPLQRADMRALKRLEEEFDEIPMTTLIGPEGERQVRCLSGEIFNLDAIPRFRAKRLVTQGRGPLPPAPAAALKAS